MKTLKLIMIGNILLGLLMASCMIAYILSTGGTAEAICKILNWVIPIFVITYFMSICSFFILLRHKYID